MLCKTVNAMSFAEYSYESEFESYPAHHKAPSTSWSKSPASQAGVGSSSLPGVIQAPIMR